jgi:hypothetical protein
LRLDLQKRLECSINRSLSAQFEFNPFFDLEAKQNKENQSAPQDAVFLV